MNRKGKIEERKPLLILFNTDPIKCLLTAAKNSTKLMDEQIYLFKKKLIQVIVFTLYHYLHRFIFLVILIFIHFRF